MLSPSFLEKFYHNQNLVYRQSLREDDLERRVFKIKKKAMYCGTMKDGNGTGTFVSSKNVVCVGQFKKYKYDGICTLLDKEGNEYRGNFAEGVREGRGKFTFQSGDVFEVNYEKGKLHGTCVYTFADRTTHVREYEHGEVQLEGKIFFPNGDVYEGEIEGDKPHGRGTYRFFLKGEYIGPCKNGKPDGKWGLLALYHLDGSISLHTGHFAKGKANGIGVRIFRGKVEVGKFVDDKLVEASTEKIQKIFDKSNDL